MSQSHMKPTHMLRIPLLIVAAFLNTYRGVGGHLDPIAAKPVTVNAVPKTADAAPNFGLPTFKTKALAFIALLAVASGLSQTDPYTVFEILLTLVTILIALPAFSLLALTLAALTVLRRTRLTQPIAPGRPPVRVAVLVPAHNESFNVLPTLANLQAQLTSTDRLLVVADNCNDDTAALARATGAEVIERQHTTLRGKGYALAFGVDYLRADPPDVVLVVDADCTVSDGAVACIAQRCNATARPVQMFNLMNAPPDAGLKLRVLEFSMLMKNLVRPMGSYRLGSACHLMGTGMALPWKLISTAQLATGHITEDMKLGIDLAIAGKAPVFLPDARVSSAFPTDSGVALIQKSRWEHGHLATLSEELLPLLAATFRSFKPASVVLSLDLLIPPVSLYFLVLVMTLVVFLGGALVWPVWQAAASVVCIAAIMFGMAIGLGWWFFGRQLLSAGELLTTPLYALWKLPVYVSYFLKKRSGWVRTKRDSE